MLITQENIKEALDAFVEAIKTDAQSKGQKIPMAWRVVVHDNGGEVWNKAYFKYLAAGRPPGKQPPPDRMLDFVQKNPHIFADAKTRFKYITEKGLAYLIGRKIGREGTDIYTGKKPGIDVLSAVDGVWSTVSKKLADAAVIRLTTNLSSQWQSK